MLLQPSRRRFIQGAAGGLVGLTSLSGYAVAIEPNRLLFPSYRLTPRNWPAGLRLRVAAIADPHICEPWMPLRRVEEIVELTNMMQPDLVVLLGDYVSQHRFVMRQVPHDDWTRIMARLRAPLGVHAVLGNHDWWDDPEAQESRKGPPRVARALERAGIPVYENRAVRLRKDGHAFWLAGLGDQWAFWTSGHSRYVGADDLPATLAQVTDDAPLILMAHEPDIFAELPDRVSLTLSGHTHGGQVQFFGYAPVVPSRYGSRYVYGNVREAERNLIVSGGLGCSGLPVRFGRPPEVPIIEIAGGEAGDLV